MCRCVRARPRRTAPPRGVEPIECVQGWANRVVTQRSDEAAGGSFGLLCRVSDRRLHEASCGSPMSVCVCAMVSILLMVKLRGSTSYNTSNASHQCSGPAGGRPGGLKIPQKDQGKKDLYDDRTMESKCPHNPTVILDEAQSSSAVRPLGYRKTSRLPPAEARRAC